MRSLALATLIAAGVLAGCGGQSAPERPVATRAQDVGAAERDVRTTIYEYFNAAYTGPPARACEFLTGGAAAAAGSTCAEAMLRTRDRAPAILRRFVMADVKRVSVRGDRAVATLDPTRWLGDRPRAFQLRRVHGHWRIADGGAAGKPTPFAVCITALASYFEDRHLAAEKVRVSKATQGEYVVRLCNRLQQNDLLDTMVSDTKSPAADKLGDDVVREMTREGKLKRDS